MPQTNHPGLFSSPPPDPRAAADSRTDLRTVEVSEDNFGQAFKDLLPLPWRLFQVGQAWDLDLHLPRLRHIKEGEVLEAICFLPAGQALAQSQAAALRKAGLAYYYVPRSQLDRVVRFTGEQLKSYLAIPDLPLAEKAEILYEHASLLVEQAMGAEKLDANLSRGRDYIETLNSFVSVTPEALRDLAQMLVLDYGLFTHSVNVCLLTTGFASHLRLPETQVMKLGLGALYHDLGKRKIPESILKKPGPLNQEEWEVMRRHPQQGFDLLAGHKVIPDESLMVVHRHHENLDGSGYPQGLGKDSLELGARLVRLVDSYDAITAVRVYKGARHAFEAVKIMVEEMKDQVDMKLLRDFVAFLGILAPQPGRQDRYERAKSAIPVPTAQRAPGVRYTPGGRRIEG